MRLLLKRQLKEMVLIRHSTLRDWTKPVNSPSGYKSAQTEWGGLRIKCWTGFNLGWIAAINPTNTPVIGAGRPGVHNLVAFF